MKYLKIFENESNYTSYKNSEDYITPNVSMIKAIGGVRMKAYVPPPPQPALAGDAAYWDGSEVKTTPLSKWNGSMGTPIGVVVVPTGFAPDRKVRIIGLKPVDENGNQSNSHVYIKWSNELVTVDTSLTNFNRVPTTDNNGSTSTGSNDRGCLPSDNTTGTTSFVDSKAKYNGTSNMIPSPYLGDVPNPEYSKEISGYNNALSDFNGLSNTETLVRLGKRYIAATAAYKHNDGVSNLQWYLPAMGELGYLAPRQKEINNTITALGGVVVKENYCLWSSSEYDRNGAYGMSMGSGYVHVPYKDDNECMWPFSTIGEIKKTVKFTIDGSEYQTEIGMTWEEWVNSQYNEIGAVVSGSYIYVGNLYIMVESAYSVSPYELIVQGEEYSIGRMSGGPGSN